MMKGWSSAQTPRGGRESAGVMKGEVDSSILSGSTISNSIPVIPNNSFGLRFHEIGSARDFVIFCCGCKLLP